ncbi:MAG TPA: hypothetical protein DIT05_03145 [Morganella sp. (in: Bacteria)]|nr:hypothetical protein [Morganella sp. (in: enterobacteria)]
MYNGSRRGGYPGFTGLSLFWYTNTHNVPLYIPLFIQPAGSLAAVSQPGHILMYAPRLSSLAACLHAE